MRKLLILTGTLPLIVAPALPANAAIHEMVAAFCSGGGVGVIDTNGFLEPPGVTTPGKESFRKPATASGVVVSGRIGDSPAAKYPEGTTVGTINTSDPFKLSTSPAAENCAAAPPP